jgi:hypothetical protein
MHVIVVAFARTVLIKLFGTDNYLVILITSIVLGVTVPITFYNLIGKKYLWFLFSTEKTAKEHSGITESNLRTSDRRISPLHPTINNI